LDGKVTRVLDGDTLDLVNQDNQTFRIRLQGIDAPEKTQAYGPEAKEVLTLLTLNRQIHVIWNEKDIYGRLIGKVTLYKKDICLEMIAQGMAWHFVKYEQNQSDEDRQLYQQTEKRVREQRKGLWADPNPVPPWDYRKQQRQRSVAKFMKTNGHNNGGTKSDDELVDLSLRQMEETSRVAALSDLSLILEIRKDGIDNDARVYELLNRVNPNWLEEPDDSDGSNPTHVSLCIPLTVAYNQVTYDHCRCESDISPCVYCACRTAIFRATKDEEFRPRPRSV
jgi:endonuclease YncB( thermonuclease family)